MYNAGIYMDVTVCIMQVIRKCLGRTDCSSETGNNCFGRRAEFFDIKDGTGSLFGERERNISDLHCVFWSVGLFC